MKKFLLTAGAVLLAAGLSLSWLGLRMGGETMATVHLFGRAWDVYAPAAGLGGTVPARDTASSAVDEVQPADPPAHAGTWENAATPSASGPVTSGQPFSSIYLDVDLGEVTIAAGDDFGVEINSWGQGYQVEHWYAEGTLHIEDTDSGIELLPKNFGSNIIVYVPEGHWLDSLDVDVDLGSLTLKGLQIREAEIDLDLGSLTGEALTADHFTVDADLGDVSLSGDLGKYVEVSADLGSVHLGLTRPAAEYCWKLEADMGSVTVDGKKQAPDDDNEVTGGRGDRVIEVDASLGSITLDFGVSLPQQALSSSADIPRVQAVAGQATEDRGEHTAADSVWQESE